jgi:uncharacterized integral membrane protein
MLVVWGLSLLIVTISNWGIPVSLVILGVPGAEIPLSVALLGAYALGGGIAALFLSIWRLQDYWQERQMVTLLAKLEDRLYALEQKARPDYFLPVGQEAVHFADSPFSEKQTTDLEEDNSNWDTEALTNSEDDDWDPYRDSSLTDEDWDPPYPPSKD